MEGGYMKNIEFRLPNAEEIELRIGTINQKGLTLLLYQDARVGMSILDETVGPMNWQRKHELINGNLFCSVGINVNYDNDKEPYFVWKQDVGVESFTEKEKGQASDSFKRAVVNWGICRCLYSAPFIWVSAEKADIKQGNNGKFQCYDKFVVEKIIYDKDRNIMCLSIMNTTKGVRVFVMDNRPKEEGK
jgi:hypothetical protein